MNARNGAVSAKPATWFGVVCDRLDGPASLHLEAFARQPLEAGMVRVQIGAAGVNFPDVLITHGGYQYRPALPFVPGMEGAGVVMEVGAGVTAFKAGDRVIATARTGLFATEAVVKASDVMAAPPAFTMTEAACFSVAARTARHALVDRAQLRRGETVLVLGAGGGVGLAAVEVAALLGARVIAAASSAEKLAVAKARGATDTVDYRTSPLVESVRAIAPEGVDVIFDPVGGSLFEQALRLPAWNGRFLVVGFASGRIGAAPANVPLIKGYSLMGVRAGESARRDPQIAARAARELAAWTAEGYLRPHVSMTFPLAKAGSALEELAGRRAIGRIALLVDADLP